MSNSLRAERLGAYANRPVNALDIDTHAQMLSDASMFTGAINEIAYLRVRYELKQ